MAEVVSLPLPSPTVGILSTSTELMTRPKDDELKFIKEAALDIPERLHAETMDVVVTAYDIASLPTGSLIVSRGSCLTILYHSNDMHCHCSILVWCSYDGSDRISLGYEPGKTRPMIFELDTYIYDATDYVNLSELGAIVRSNEYAYRPQEFLLSHPRYLETVAQLIRILPLTHISNDTNYGCLHKWQPKYWTKPEAVGFANVRDYYYELAAEKNPLAASLRQVRRVSSTCVDLIISFVSLLHEELYIRLTPQELSEGQLPASKRLLAVNVDTYDVSRLLRSNSELYQLYDKKSHVFLKGVHTHPRKMDIMVFFAPVIFFSILFVCFLFFLKPIVSVSFGSTLHVGQLPF